MLESQFSHDSKTCQVKKCLNLDDLNEAEVVKNTLLNANMFPVLDMSYRFGCSASKGKAKATDGGFLFLIKTHFHEKYCWFQVIGKFSF